MSKWSKQRGPLYKKLHETRSNMLSRCYNPRVESFALYGAKGIGVCQAWRDSYAQFAEDMGLPPSLAHSIDRIDSSGDYEPGNVRWALAHEQAWNTERTLLDPEDARRIYMDPRVSATAVARDYPVTRHTVLRIWSRSQWGEATRDCPPRERIVMRARLEAEKQDKRIAELYRGGLPIKAIGKRLGTSGWTVARALDRLGVPRRRGKFRGTVSSCPVRERRADAMPKPEVAS